MNKKVFIRTFGCQMNDRDSELIAGMLIEKGYEVCDDADKADVVLLNTCSVRQHAEDRVKGLIHKFSARKKKDPSFRIGVLGCMAQRHGEMLAKEFSLVDIVVGPSNIYDLPALLEQSFIQERIFAVNNLKRPVKDVNPAHRAGTFTAFVNITYGCDNYCSYCIVPYVRGREVSRPMKDIVKEVKELAEKGFKEVTFLGQNVNSYGKGLADKNGFPALLEETNKIKGMERIRFVTSHPKDAGRLLFKAMHDLDKVCEHIHLPIQSGSNKMLDLMNRKYTIEDYRAKVELLREMVPGVGISTDIIVGFPSEKESDFKATARAMEEIRFNSAFVFKYSPRPPAMSACLVDDVPEEVKKERNNMLLDVQKNVSYAINKSLVDSEQEVLVEGKSRMSESEMIGRTRNNTSCVLPGDGSMVGKLVKVRIKSASTYTLKGEVLATG